MAPDQRPPDAVGSIRWLRRRPAANGCLVTPGGSKVVAKAVDRAELPPEQIRRLLSGVPFFNEVLRQDAAQFELLLNCCTISRAAPGAMVIRQGAEDSGLYFLLRGRLVVKAEASLPEQAVQPLNHISPGEVFGTLSLVRGAPRSATLYVDEHGSEAVLARIDFMYFSYAVDYPLFSLATKLSFYRMLVHNIRWTLEMNRTRDPHHELASKLRKVPLYTGARGTRDELAALHEQASALADLLCRWNESGVPATGAG